MLCKSLPEGAISSLAFGNFLNFFFFQTFAVSCGFCGSRTSDREGDWLYSVSFPPGAECLPPPCFICFSCVDSLRPHGLYTPWNSGQNTGVGSRSLLQGIFPAQGSNLGLWHCRQTLYHLSHQGGPKIWSQMCYHCPMRSQKTQMPKQGHEPWTLRLKVWCFQTELSRHTYIQPIHTSKSEFVQRVFMSNFPYKVLED